jgi:hypothetical protein
LKPEEYIKTIVVYGKMVNVGMDDYGQQYFIEYVNDNGELVEVGCGAYNTDYEDVAKCLIDRRRQMVEEWGEEEVLEMERQTAEREARRWNEEMRNIVCREK